MFNITDLLKKENTIEMTKPTSDNQAPVNRSKWFCDLRFYMVIIINCSTRLVFNQIATYMPFYMQMSTDIEKIFVALIPLIQFISGFIISFVMELTAAKIGKELVFILGACLNVTAGLVLGLVKGASFSLLIPMAIIIGIGTSTTG